MDREDIAAGPQDFLIRKAAEATASLCAPFYAWERARTWVNSPTKAK